jgi:type II secretory pathway pseudopilin PulG
VVLGSKLFFATRTRRRLCGFTLVEALVSTAVTVIAGSAILLSLGSSLQTTEAAREEAIAAGIAQQIMDEIAGKRYGAPGADPRQWPLGPAAHEGNQRYKYDDLDDFHGWLSAPCDPWGVVLGQGDGEGSLRHANFRLRDGYFQKWRTAVEVFYVSDSDLSKLLAAGQTSYHRAAKVRVFVDRSDGSSRQLATLQRVFSYVPAP